MPRLLEDSFIDGILYNLVGYCTVGSFLGMIIVEDEVMGVIFSRRNFAAVLADKMLQFGAIGDLKGDVEPPTGENSVCHL